ETHRDVIMPLARLEKFEIADTAPAGSVKTVVDEATVVLEIADLIDAGEEIARLDKQLGKLGGEITGLEKRLGNEAFVAKAPAEVVAEQRERLADLQGTRDKLSVAREQLAAL
ncbi:MAG: valine--tRNA ligase, partial [Pseudomonadota bacterium]